MASLYQVSWDGLILDWPIFIPYGTIHVGEPHCDPAPKDFGPSGLHIPSGESFLVEQ